MTEQTVTLRIVGENGKLVGAVRVAKAELKGLGDVTTATGARARSGARGIDEIGNAAERSRRKMRGLAGDMGGFRSLLAGIGGVQAARGLVLMADTYSDIVGKLAAVTAGERELAAAKAATFAIAQKTYQSLDATVTLYTRSAMALQQYGVSQSVVAQLTETINQGLLVSRATTAESASAILQLSQALGAGALRGEEFNAVNEAAPRLMQALAESLGVPRGELKKLAEDGKLTIDVLLKAWTGANAKKIAEEASKVPLTISRAWQQARNQMLRYVGEADQAGGTSAQVAQAIQLLSRNLGAVISGLVTAVKITAAWFVLYRGIPAVVAGLQAVRNAYISIALAQQMGIRGSGLFAAASIKGMQGIKTAAGVLFAAFAGWQIGKWLRENFLEAQLAGIALVNGLLTYFQKLKREALLNFAQIKFGIKAAFEFIGNTVAAGYDKLAAGASKIGLDGVAERYRGAAEGARQAQVAESEYAASKAKINAAYEAEVGQIQAITDGMADYAIAQFQAKGAAEGATNAEGDLALALGKTGDAAKAAKDNAAQLAQERADFARTVRQLEAQMAGPAAQAQFDYADAVEQANAALQRGAAARADVIKYEALQQRQRDETLQQLAREGDVVERLLADYDAQIRLSGLSGRARRVEEQVLRAVADAHAAANAQKKEELRLTPQAIEDLRRSIDMREQVIEVNERQRRAAEEFASTWTNAVDSVSAAFGDWMARGFKDFDGFLDSMKSIFQRWIADIISMFARAQLARVASGWLSALGGTSTGTNWQSLALQGVSQYLGGGSGGFSSAGGASNYLSMFGGMFGGGGSAAAVGTWAGLGTTSLTGLGASGAAGAAGTYGAFAPNVAGFSAAGGSGSAGAAGASGAGGAAAALWVLAIIAGMYQNAQWYKQGWNVNGQRNDIARSSGYNLDNMAVMGADRMLRSLGVNGKWAAILSGSAGIAKAWGRQKPTISGTGFMGTIGFDGFNGQSYADIKQRGGWFRSDKKWTQTGQISAGIDRAFDSIAISIRGRAQGIAEQLGTDITQALSSFKLDLGKIKLDKDPEKAKQQIADKIAEVTEKMINAAVGALGFGDLLDDGFAASDIMTALSASIELVTGSAKDLGRALTDFEKGNITKAVEYFEGLALKNGTELASEVERVLGILNSYSGVMGGVNQQLRTAGLNDYQKAQLDIELQYRSQVKQLNDLAKALGLSGARAEDLAQLEQLRALNMANLQKQMEAQRNSFLSELGLSDLSPLRDDQKLAESMQQLRDAVASGDLAGAQGYAQTALGLGRNLYASGLDYNSLYDEVTGLIQDMGLEATAGLDDETLREIADGILGLPDGIARALFNLAAGINPVPPAPVAPTGTANDPNANLQTTLTGIATQLQQLITLQQLDGMRGPRFSYVTP